MAHIFRGQGRTIGRLLAPLLTLVCTVITNAPATAQLYGLEQQRSEAFSDKGYGNDSDGITSIAFSQAGQGHSIGLLFAILTNAAGASQIYIPPVSCGIDSLLQGP
jgi:hypothetical protein